MSIKDLCKSYLVKYPHLSKNKTKLARRLKEENPKETFDYSVEQLRQIMYKIETNVVKEEDELDIQIEKEQKWTVIDGLYNWKANRGIVSMTVDAIDSLFYDYSEHGRNLTQTQIINKYNLKVWEWNSIKNTLQLYKKANIFSPYTVEITPSEKLAEMIKEKISKMISNVGEQVETIYNKEISKAYKKVISENEEWNLRKNIILTELADIVPQLTVELKPTLRVCQDSEGVISVFIADVHYGAESRTKSIGPYSPEITEEQFKEIAEEINKHNAKEVHIFFIGDNIESATGLNHIDSWKGLAKGFYGSQLIIRAYKTFVAFLSQVTNLKKAYAVPGNHDRMTANNKEDGQGFLAEILFEMIRLAFQGKLDVKYEEKVISESVDGLQFIMTHGHLKLTDAPPAELILDYGDPYKFNVLVSGHYHTRKVRKDHRNFRQLVCPSVFPGNDYSENLGVSSTPGFIMIKTKNGKPFVYDCPL